MLSSRPLSFYSPVALWADLIQLSYRPQYYGIVNYKTVAAYWLSDKSSPTCAYSPWQRKGQGRDRVHQPVSQFLFCPEPSWKLYHSVRLRAAWDISSSVESSPRFLVLLRRQLKCLPKFFHVWIFLIHTVFPAWVICTIERKFNISCTQIVSQGSVHTLEPAWYYSRGSDHTPRIHQHVTLQSDL